MWNEYADAPLPPSDTYYNVIPSTQLPCTVSDTVAVLSGETVEITLTVPDAYKHGTTSSGTWSGNVVTTAAITADTEVTLGCETRKYGGVVKP